MQYTCLPVYLSTCLPIYLSTSLTVYLATYLPVYLSLNRYDRPPGYLSTYLSYQIQNYDLKYEICVKEWFWDHEFKIIYFQTHIKYKKYEYEKFAMKMNLFIKNNEWKIENKLKGLYA